MRKEDLKNTLFDAMADIDDKFILEAAPSEEMKAGKVTRFPGKKSLKIIVPTIGGLCAAALILIITNNAISMNRSKAAAPTNAQYMAVDLTATEAAGAYYDDVDGINSQLYANGGVNVEDAINSIVNWADKNIAGATEAAQAAEDVADGVWCDNEALAETGAEVAVLETEQATSAAGIIIAPSTVAESSEAGNEPSIAGVSESRVLIVMADIENFGDAIESYFADNNYEIIYKYDIISGYAILIPEGEDMDQAIDELSALEGVYSVERDQTVSLDNN